MTAEPNLACRPCAGKHDAGIDYELFLDCVHCGLCTSACPTYVELGDENDSPRGRIYLMRAVTDGRLELDESVQRHLDLCLDCRACESACPSGVQYGKLIEPFRIHMQKIGREDGDAELAASASCCFSSRRTPAACGWRWRRPGSCSGRAWIALLRKLGFYTLLPRSLRQMHDMLPPLEAALRLAAGGAAGGGAAAGARRAVHRLRRRRVLSGDEPGHRPRAAEERLRGVDPARPGLLRRVALPLGPGRAGQGSSPPQTATTFLPPAASADDVDAIIVNAAGCGAMLKDYGHLLHGTPQRRSSARVRDEGEGHQRVPDGARPDQADASAQAEGDLSRRLPPVPRPADSQAAAAAAGDDPRPGTGAA